MKQQDSLITSAILVIGDEILSGKTKDQNIGYIADYMIELGIDLKEVRIVPDEAGMIIEALNALRQRYDYVFTTGGIGPTHDDITAPCVARAFGLDLKLNPQALEMLKKFIPEAEINESRLRMAMIPDGAELIPNAVSGAPGFRVDNVYVMAGVPKIMQSMIRAIGPSLKQGRQVHSLFIDADGFLEGDYAAGLGMIAEHYSNVSIGSYPNMTDKGFKNQIVLRGREPKELDLVKNEIMKLLTSLPKRY